MTACCCVQSDEPVTEISLRTYSSSREVRSAIDKIVQKGGLSNVGELLAVSCRLQQTLVNTSVKVKRVPSWHASLPRHIFTCKDRIKSKFAARLNVSLAPCIPHFSPVLTKTLTFQQLQGVGFQRAGAVFLLWMVCQHLYGMLNFVGW